jgi:uncharacterized hydantoinase/oxoprolinase family protein
MQRIAAERFATMADVWRLMGDLPADADPYPSPDLKGKGTQESAARLARMLGRDLKDGELLAYADVARHFAESQIAEIADATGTLIAREDMSPDAPVIGAGCGHFLARQVANRLGRPYGEFAALIDRAPGSEEMAAVCAAAVAVAMLAERALSVAPDDLERRAVP